MHSEARGGVWTFLGGLAVAGLAVACAVGGPGIDRAADEAAARVAAGRSLYASFCSSCHGAGARGDGPVRDSLRVQPADLTRISVRHGGSFPAARVAGHIDGRDGIDAHGTREMPVWGRLYDDRNARILDDETLLSPGMIFNIVAFLESIQEPVPAAISEDVP